MTTVYSVSHSEGVDYFATKAEAVASAREARKAGDVYVTVDRNTVANWIGRRALYVALLNGSSWCAAREQVTGW